MNKDNLTSNYFKKSFSPSPEFLSMNIKELDTFPYKSVPLKVLFVLKQYISLTRIEILYEIAS